MNILKRIGAWLAAVISVVLLGVIFQTQNIIARLVNLGAMKQAFFDVHIIAGARDVLGIALQVLSGIIGGWLFAHLTRNLIKAKTA